MGFLTQIVGRKQLPAVVNKPGTTLARTEARSVSGPYSASDPPKDFVVWMGGGATASGMVVTPKIALTIVTFFRAVQITCESLAMLPIHFSAEDKNAKDPYGRKLSAYHILNKRANIESTAFDYRSRLWIDIMQFGNHFSQKVYNAFGDVIELWPLDASKVRPFRKDGVLGWKYFRENGVIVEFKAEDIMHVKGISVDGILGVSPVQAAANSLGLNIALELCSANLFKNGARPSGILTMPGHFKDRSRAKHLSDEWQELMAGVENYGKPIILEDDLKWQELSQSMIDSQTIEQRNFQKLEVATLTGVPPIKLGITDTATYGSTEQQMLAFIIDSLQTKATNLEQVVWHNLLSLEEQKKYFPKHNFNALLRGDSETRSKVYTAGRLGGWYSADDIRDYEDLPRLPDGAGQFYLSPVNMMDASCVSEFWQLRLKQMGLQADQLKQQQEAPQNDPASVTDPGATVSQDAATTSKDSTKTSKSAELVTENRLNNPGPEIKLAFASAILAVSERAVRKEVKQLQTALKQAALKGSVEHFRSKVEELWGGFETQLVDELSPICSGVAAFWGRNEPNLGAIVSENVANFCKKDAQEARNRLILQDFSKESEVFVKIGEILEDWAESRAQAVCVGILESIVKSVPGGVL